jgi:hypothetical protein
LVGLLQFMSLFVKLYSILLRAHGLVGLLQFMSLFFNTTSTFHNLLKFYVRYLPSHFGIGDLSLRINLGVGRFCEIGLNHLASKGDIDI